jgi:hypothetical protein
MSHSSFDPRVTSLTTQLEFLTPDGATTSQDIVWTAITTVNGPRFYYTVLPAWQFSPVFVDQFNTHARSLSESLGVPFDTIQ